jgi:hypothetical protein
MIAPPGQRTAGAVNIANLNTACNGGDFGDWQGLTATRKCRMRTRLPANWFRMDPANSPR